MIRITDQYFWNVIFIFFYIGLLIMAGIILSSEARMAYSELTVIDIVLIVLASFRVTQLFVYDSMTKFIREQFYDVVEVRSKVTLARPTTGPRRTLADLMGSPWSFGITATTVVTFFYLLTPLAFLPIFILAMASIVSVLQLIVSLLGLRTEQLKRDSETL